MRRFTIQDATGVIVSSGDGNYLTYHNEGAPTDSQAGWTKGALWFDTTNANLYINIGTATSSDWQKLTYEEGPMNGLVQNVLDVTADKTLTLADSGSIVMLNLAGGFTLTLPATTAANLGWWCDIFVQTTATTDYIIQSATAATDLWFGGISITSTTLNQGDSFSAGASDDQIKLNGTTKGGIAGGFLKIAIIAAGKMSVGGTLIGSGTIVTPFASSA